MNHVADETVPGGGRSGPRSFDRRPAQTPAGPPTAVKALLIGLTADEHIGAGVTADIKIVEGYVRGLPGFDADHDLKKLTGAQVTPANIERAIEDLDVQPTDVLFCYYAGHGAYDADLNADDDPSGGHFFQIPGGDLRRADLLGWLTDKGTRLTVLISETCNAAGDYNPPDPNAGDSAPATDGGQDAETPPEAVASRTFRTLLFDFTGVVDVSGASRDEYGMAGDDGSLSTLGMVQALEDEDKSAGDFLSLLLDPTAKSPVDWDRFLQDASEDVHTLFQKSKDDILAQPEPDDEAAKEFRQALRDQDDLRPQTFRLDVRPLGQAEDDKDFVPPPPPPDSIHCVFFLPSAARIP